MNSSYLICFLVNGMFVAYLCKAMFDVLFRLFCGGGKGGRKHFDGQVVNLYIWV